MIDRDIKRSLNHWLRSTILVSVLIISIRPIDLLSCIYGVVYFITFIYLLDMHQKNKWGNPLWLYNSLYLASCLVGNTDKSYWSMAAYNLCQTIKEISLHGHARSSTYLSAISVFIIGIVNINTRPILIIPLITVIINVFPCHQFRILSSNALQIQKKSAAQSKYELARQQELICEIKLRTNRYQYK